MKNARIRRRISAVALNALIAVLAVLWLVPVFWLVVSSFRAEQGAYTPYLWPKAFTFDNYIRLFTDRRLFDFPRWLGNTLFVAGCSCVLTTMLTLMVAYVYSRLRFPKRRFLMNASLVLGMFPGFMSIIAIYHFMKAIGLDQTLLALILVYSGGAALLALQAGVPVIPVYSAGNYQPFQRLQLQFGAPIVLTQRPNAAGVQEATQCLQEAMERLQEELYQEMKPKYRKRAAEFHRRFRETTLRRQREQQEGEKNHDA